MLFHLIMIFLFVSVTPIVPYFLPKSAESSKEICAQLKQPYENDTNSSIGGDFNANISSLTKQGMVHIKNHSKSLILILKIISFKVS